VRGILREPGACRGVDERRRFGDAAFKVAPSAHHHLELVEDTVGVFGGERDHPRTEVPHRRDLEAMLQDVAVTSQDEPASAGNLGDPLVILDRRTRDGAGRPAAFVDHRSRVSGIGEVGAQVGEHMPETEQVCVDVETDLGRFGRAHAARWEFS
jgi:hypothetical protein